jgi:hypothetical protein
MIITVLLSFMMMAGLFLMLLAGVGFIQQYRFFSSAPKEVRNAVPKTKPERFKGQHAIGWVMIVISFALMDGAVVLGAWNGIANGFSFWQFYLRFFLMLILLKAFDVGFFDWVLLSNAGFNFFPHFYPECKPVLGRYLFGYNWKTHLLHVIMFFPSVALLSWICTLF